MYNNNNSWISFLVGCETRLVILAELCGKRYKDSDLDYALGIGVNKSVCIPALRRSTTAGSCRCGSTTHKRVNHSSCILNPKTATSLNGKTAHAHENPSLEGETENEGEDIMHRS